MVHPLQAFFGRIPIFSDLTPDELNEVLRSIQPAQLAKGDILFKEGEPGDAAYIVESGEIQIYLDRKDGRIDLATFGANAIIGEVTLLDAKKRTANAMAATDVSLFRIDKQEFDFLRRNLHPAAYKVIRKIAFTVCERLRDTNALITHALNDDGSEKLVARPDEVGDSAPRGFLNKIAFWRQR